MSSDSRVEDMDNFTPTVHSKIPAQLEPSKTVLPHPFVVCVIGASSGIGEYIAYAYAEAGASGIVLSSRKIPDLHVVAQKVTSISPSIKIMVEACDIASASSVAALAEKVKSAFGRLDVLVPNSGFAGPVTLKVTEGSPDNFQQNFGVNCIGTYHAAHYFIPLLLSSTKGAKSLIVVGSFAACIKSGPIANTGYCLSKFAQSRLVEFIAEQYEREGLLAVCVHPGAVLTPSAAPNTPEVFLPYLVDDVGLCGAFCVWLTKDRRERSMQWLSGRFVSANWDVDELLAKKTEIMEKDLLRWQVGTS